MSNNEVEYLGTKKKIFVDDGDVEYLGSSMSPSATAKTYAEHLGESPNLVTNDDLVPVRQEGVNNEGSDLDQSASAQGHSVEDTVVEHRHHQPLALAKAIARLRERFPDPAPSAHGAAEPLLRETSRASSHERLKSAQAKIRVRRDIIRNKTHRTEQEEALLRREEKRLEKARDKAKQQREKKKAEEERTMTTLESLKEEVKALTEWKEDHLDFAEARREHILELETKVRYWERKALLVENQE